MKIIRLFTLIILFTTGFGLPSCSDDCSCPPVKGTFFSIQGISLSNYERAAAAPPQVVEEKDTVKAANYRLDISFETEYVSSLHSPHKASFSLMNSVYACSCLYEGMEGAKEKIESLQLVSLQDFDEQHLAGDTVTHFFEVDHYGTTTEPEAFFQQKLWQEQYFLTLNKSPTSGEPLQLKLVLRLDNGKVLEAMSEAVFIR